LIESLKISEGRPFKMGYMGRILRADLEKGSVEEVLWHNKENISMIQL